MNKLIFVGLAFVFYSCTSKTEHAKLTFLLKGNESFEEGNLEKANYYYNEAILTDSTYVDAYLNNALVLEAKGELYGAIEMYDAILILNSENEDALHKRANLYLDVDQYYRALDDLKVLEKSWKDSASLYFTIGLVNTKLKRYNVAIKEFEKSISINANQAQAFINIGNVYYYKNEYDSAIQFLAKGLELDPTEANGLNTQGLIATKNKEFKKALNLFDKAIMLEKKNGWYVNNKAFVFLQMDQLDSANYLMNESMKMDPYNAWVYRNKGLLAIKKEQYTKGLKYLEKAYKMDKAIDDLLTDLAKAYALNGKNKEACALSKTEQTLEVKSELVKIYCL